MYDSRWTIRKDIQIFITNTEVNQSSGYGTNTVVNTKTVYYHVHSECKNK